MKEARPTFGDPLEPTSDFKNLVEVFPDGFEMSYVDLWHVGGPRPESHYEAFDRLVQKHGGLPKCYLRNS